MKKYIFNSLDIFNSDLFYKGEKIFLEIDVKNNYLALDTNEQ
jgi:hypothetical protein